MDNDKKDKIINVLKYLFFTIIIILILVGLINQVYSINNNYRKYEFKLVTNAINVPLGKSVEVPISLINDDDVNFNDYSYTSSEPSIVSVTDDGEIVANKVGSTVIVVKAKKSNQKELLNVNVVLVDAMLDSENE